VKPISAFTSRSRSAKTTKSSCCLNGGGAAVRLTMKSGQFCGGFGSMNAFHSGIFKSSPSSDPEAPERMSVIAFHISSCVCSEIPGNSPPFTSGSRTCGSTSRVGIKPSRSHLSCTSCWSFVARVGIARTVSVTGNQLLDAPRRTGRSRSLHPSSARPR
jgi:hypothetical protein